MDSQGQVIYELILEIERLTKLVRNHYAWDESLGVHNIKPALQEMDWILDRLNDLRDEL